MHVGFFFIRIRPDSWEKMIKLIQTSCISADTKIWRQFLSAKFSLGARGSFMISFPCSWPDGRFKNIFFSVVEIKSICFCFFWDYNVPPLTQRFLEKHGVELLSFRSDSWRDCTRKLQTVMIDVWPARLTCTTLQSVFLGINLCYIHWLGSASQPIQVEVCFGCGLAGMQ